MDHAPRRQMYEEERVDLAEQEGIVDLVAEVDTFSTMKRWSVTVEREDRSMAARRRQELELNQWGNTCTSLGSLQCFRLGSVRA
jgi:hypothetical protein